VRALHERLDAALHAVAEVHIHAGGGVDLLGFWILDFGLRDIGKMKMVMLRLGSEIKSFRAKNAQSVWNLPQVGQ
jgi:hypothetical protein